MSKRRVACYYDPCVPARLRNPPLTSITADVGPYTYGLGHPMKLHRVRVTHDLVSAYGMVPKMHVLRAKRTTPESMTAFHTDEYIDFLGRVTPETQEGLTHGVVGVFLHFRPGVHRAAQRISSGATDIAINWGGGLHHAKKGEASGFCYINGIVLCILELLRTYPRALYINIDIHHGDGVEEAFYSTDRVMTASSHKFGKFFPGTGTQDDHSRGRGKGYSLNVPLNNGITDAAFQGVVEPKILEIHGGRTAVRRGLALERQARRSASTFKRRFARAGVHPEGSWIDVREPLGDRIGVVGRPDEGVRNDEWK
ncbi:hypothetical protein FB451DRAFT_1050437 [Mycena latifolia]|nr:hypothetical protein FB451DRAFT_1050437 [Mycena latifolia]